VELVEPHPFPGETDEVGGFDLSVSVRADRGSRLLIGNDKQDVGPFRPGGK
jgi:hypothetical protein